MNRLYILAFLISVFTVLCSQPQEHNVAAQLKNKKYTIDSLINKQRNLIVMAKLKGQEAIVETRGNNNVETVYNIYKDNKGIIIYISEMPKSPDDEWFIAYKSYFDEKGNLFAFQRQNNFFHSGCTKGAALENLVKYYDEKHEIADSTYSFTDSYKKDLSKSRCKFPYNFPYKINKTLEEYRQRVKGL